MVDGRAVLRAVSARSGGSSFGVVGSAGSLGLGCLLLQLLLLQLQQLLLNHLLLLRSESCNRARSLAMVEGLRFLLSRLLLLYLLVVFWSGAL
jgi:hypothetical protein